MTLTDPLLVAWVAESSDCSLVVLRVSSGNQTICIEAKEHQTISDPLFTQSDADDLHTKADNPFLPEL